MQAPTRSYRRLILAIPAHDLLPLRRLIMSHGSAATRGLAGRRIVITRPAEQADTLAQLIRDQGGAPMLFPAIVIRDVSDPTQLNSVIDRLDSFGVAIFISPNAARRGMQAVRARRELPPSLNMVAIGGGTARELERQGVHSVIVPKERFDSDSLLELPEMQHVEALRVVIFRGEGGRALLGDTLSARGAIVEYAECYRREKPGAAPRALIDACSAGEIDGIVVTSSEGLRNLYALLDERAREQIAHVTWFVPHPRIASTARDLGLSSVVITEPGDSGLARGIAQHFAAPP
jgi:uroporphyrinogen-III synthase